MSKFKVTVIAPVYQEVEVIEKFHLTLVEVLQSLKDVESSILYVVDHCTDGTIEVLREIIKNTCQARAIVMSANFGHQMALIAGIDNSCESDALIMMDSDLQHPPELIRDLIAAYNRGFEVVYTVRRDTQDISLPRKLLGNMFYKLLSGLAASPMVANAADFRLISSRVAKILSTEFHEKNVFLRGLISYIGFRQTCVEYCASKRLGGESKYSLIKILQFALVGIISSSVKPLKLGIITGLMFSVASIILVIWVILEYFIDSAIPSGWTTIVVLILLSTTFQLTVLGIVGVYIGAIYEEVKRRPRYIIDERIGFDGFPKN